MTKLTDDGRDEKIGEALKSIPVPRTSPSFFSDLMESIDSQSRESSVAVSSGESRESARLPVWRRGRVGLAASLAALVFFGGFVAGGVQAQTPTPTLASITTFEPAAGWSTLESSIGSDPEALRTVWAANIPFQSEELFTGFPDNTLRGLPSNGVVIVAAGPRSYTGSEQFPHLDFPIKLSDGYFVSDNYDGQPAPNVSMYTIDTWVGNKLLNLSVWIGSPHPDDSLVNTANEELARLHVPS